MKKVYLLVSLLFLVASICYSGEDKLPDYQTRSSKDSWEIPASWKSFGPDISYDKAPIIEHDYSYGVNAPDFDLDFGLVVNAADPNFKKPIAAIDGTVAIYLDTDVTGAVIAASGSSALRMEVDSTKVGAPVLKSPLVDISEYDRVIFVTKGDTKHITLDKSLDELGVSSIGLYAPKGGVIEVLNEELQTTVVSYEGRSVIIFTGEQNKYVYMGGDNSVLIGELGAAAKTAFKPTVTDNGKRICYVPTGSDCSSATYCYNNFFYGGPGSELIWGTNLRDHMRGGDGHDDMRGLDGDDFVFGEYGNDTVNGNKGNDTVYGGYGNDLCYGGQGNDVVRGISGSNTVNGNDGCDTCREGTYYANCEQ